MHCCADAALGKSLLETYQIWISNVHIDTITNAMKSPTE